MDLLASNDLIVSQLTSATQKAYESYKKFLVLYMFFTKKKHEFDKIKPKIEKFLKRKDIGCFERLSKHKDQDGLISATLIRQPDAWIDDIVSNMGKSSYKERTKNLESLYYILGHVDTSLPTSGYPPIIRDYLGGRLGPEVVVVALKSMDLFDTLDALLVDDPVWQPISWRLRKYCKFVSFDKERVIKVLRP